LVLNFYFMILETAFNPSYSGGRDQKDHGSRLAWAKSWQDPISTNKKLGMVAPVIPAIQEA
jgi:hypothetical protein